MKMVVVGGWWAKKYRNKEVVIWGNIEKETEKAIKIGRKWIPKQCVKEIKDIDEEEFYKVLDNAETEEDVLKAYNLENEFNTFVDEGDCFVAYTF